MFHLTLSTELTSRCPEYRGAAVYAEVVNSPFSEGLWQEIDAFTQELRARDTADSIKQQPAIAATREAYRRLGKDPSRYRPSAEALRRRLLRGLELYRIDTLVDLINLVSLRTGYSIGGFERTRFRARTSAWAWDKRESRSKASGVACSTSRGCPCGAMHREASARPPATTNGRRWMWGHDISWPSSTGMTGMNDGCAKRRR